MKFNITTLEQLESFLMSGNAANIILEEYCIDLLRVNYVTKNPPDVISIDFSEAIKLITKYNSSFISSENKRLWHHILFSKINIEQMLDAGLIVNKNSPILPALCFRYLMEKNMSNESIQETKRLEKELIFSGKIIEKNFGKKLVLEQIEKFILIAIKSSHLIETKSINFITNLYNNYDEKDKFYLDYLILEANFKIYKNYGFFGHSETMLTNQPIFETLMKTDTDFIIKNAPQFVPKLYELYTYDNSYHEYLNKAVLSNKLDNALEHKLCKNVPTKL